MQQPGHLEHENVYEIRFKNTRKSFYRNVNGLSLITGDYVAVESDRGFDVGQVSLGGVLARLQMKKRRINPDSDRVRKIYRRATKEDMRKLGKARDREQETLVRTRVIVNDLRLDMKASDVEFQGDNTKAIFYYIADTRVDFRELIKRLANEFRIRVEMKQIGPRHEAGLVGGIGSCGRELCCSTWLTDFKTVSTAAARYQNLSLNPMKISGQCGRLKCCLNFELETYMDAMKDIPKVDRIETESGLAFLQKTDIFKRIMWFSYKGETTWIPLEVDKVVEMLQLKASGEMPTSLLAYHTEEPDAEVDFVDVVGQATLREEPRRRKKKNKKRKPRPQAQQQNQGTAKGRPFNRSRGGRRNNRDQAGNNSGGSGNSSNPHSQKDRRSGRDPRSGDGKPRSQGRNSGNNRSGGRGGEAKRGGGGRNQPNKDSGN
ncbi:MAG: regulatory iron-sulfur-containing complex subunit RicT [Bacteroidota bacterium]